LWFSAQQFHRRYHDFFIGSRQGFLGFGFGFGFAFAFFFAMRFSPPPDLSENLNSNQSRKVSSAARKVRLSQPGVKNFSQFFG